MYFIIKGELTKVRFNQQKKETDKGFMHSNEKDSLERSAENEKTPEFDVIGTALNGL